MSHVAKNPIKQCLNTFESASASESNADLNAVISSY
jgi:hypothetical protein